VRKVYQELKKRQLRGQGYLRVYLDAECIKPGSDWRKQFVDGLTHSLVFVPFISRGSLLNMAGEPPSDKHLDEVSMREYPPMKQRLQIGPDEKADNVLLEWQLALTLQGMGGRYSLTCQEVLPLLLGHPFGDPQTSDDDPPKEGSTTGSWELEQDKWMEKTFSKAADDFKKLPSATEVFDRLD
jgi:hypothetical protein